MRRLALLVGVAMLALSARAPDVRGAEPPNAWATGVTWGTVGLEIFGAAAAVLDLTVAGVHDDDTVEVLVLTLPALLGAGLGALAGWQGWPTSIPRAAHGALWTGFDLFLAGTLTHGALEPGGDGLRLGPMAWTMGALGAGLGGYWGASKISDGDDFVLWMSAPYVSGLVSLVSAGALALAGWAGGWKDRTTMQAIGWTGVGWFTAGLGVAYAAPWIVAPSREHTEQLAFDLSRRFEPLTLPRFGAFAPGR